jgi:diguanylate cyclase (GGDEF)-like protein
VRAAPREAPRTAIPDPDTGPIGGVGGAPAVEPPDPGEWETDGSTDIMQVLPAALQASEATQRQYILRVLAGPQTGLSRVVDRDEILLGRGTSCDLVLADSALSRRHCKILRTPDGLAVEDLGSSNGTFVDAEPVRGKRALQEGDRVQVGRHTVLGIALQDQLELQAARQLYEFSMRDPLTGMHNRRYFDQRLSEEFAYALRHRSPISVLVVDLDLFKRINDTWGHPAGDRVIRHAADIIQGCVRKEDVAARIGGEEFAMLARIQMPEGALALGERVRQKLEASPVAFDGHVIRITASLGIASTFTDRSYESAAVLMAAADRALYRAKSSGRNRCQDDRSASARTGR